MMIILEICLYLGMFVLAVILLAGLVVVFNYVVVPLLRWSGIRGTFFLRMVEYIYYREEFKKWVADKKDRIDTNKKFWR